MPAILNINSNYDINTKKFFRKLSFEVGQIFSAKVENLDKLTGEILLKMLDGWQFAAKLEGNLDNLAEGLMKFQVDDFVDGKLQIKLVNGDNSKKQNENPVETLLRESNLNLDKDDFPLLSKMVKHNIPLTKENISDIKTFSDFVKKLNNSPQEGESFINKYLESKGIDIASSKGQTLKTILKGFFGELKNMSSNDIMTFMENNIDLTEDNIKSFNNIFKESGKLFSDIKNINKVILEDKVLSNFETKNSLNENKDMGNNAINKDISKEAVSKNSINDESFYKDSEKTTVSVKDTATKNLVSKEENSANQLKNLSEGNNEVENISSDKIKDTTKLNEKITNKGLELKQETLSDIAKNVKSEIANKSEEMKNIIKSIIEIKSDLKSDVYNNILQVLDKNMNDFKVFNSVSNQYYYLDLPINMDSSEYQCKLMIKDERQKGKKIDSTNVKIAASVSTVNMGVVDAYIKVNNFNMDVDIKCEELWIKILDKSKDKMLESLANIDYNIFVRVDKKEVEMNLVNCREFFEDKSLGVIDKKV